MGDIINCCQYVSRFLNFKITIAILRDSFIYNSDRLLHIIALHIVWITITLVLHIKRVASCIFFSNFTTTTDTVVVGLYVWARRNLYFLLNKKKVGNSCKQGGIFHNFVLH